MMPSPPRQASLLSIHRAFVIHLQAEIDLGQGLVAGRIEHVVSGQVSRFHSLDELLAFMTKILSPVSEPRSDSDTGTNTDVC